MFDILKKINYFIKNNYSIILQFVAFSLIIFGLKLWLINNNGNATPYWDQWDAEADLLYLPLLENRLKLKALFALHNEHRILTTRILALILLKINGIWNPLLQMVVNSILNIFSICLFILLFINKFGKKYVIPILFFSICLFGFPYGWENTLAGFQAQFYFVVIFSVLSIWITLNNSPFSLKWFVGLIYGFLAFFSLASGIFVFLTLSTIYFLFYFKKYKRQKNQFLIGGLFFCIFLLGYYLTPSLSHHASLKVTSINQFLSAIIVVFSWPLKKNVFLAMFRNLPSIIFLIILFYKKNIIKSKHWFILGIVIWTITQALSLAYGRGGAQLSSRYYDLLAYSILVNFFCLLIIISKFSKRNKKMIMLISFGWTFVIISGLTRSTIAEQAAIHNRKNTALIQEKNISEYIKTKEIEHLKNKPHLEIPYPDYRRLALILDSSVIRSILPSNIRQKIKCETVYGFDEINIENEYFLEDQGLFAKIHETDYKINSKKNILYSMKIICNGTDKKSLVAFPFSEYPKKFEVILIQEDRKIPLYIIKDQKSNWGHGYVLLNEGPFSLHIIGSDDLLGLEFKNPVVVGNLYLIVDILLRYYYAPIILGTCIYIKLFYKK